MKNILLILFPLIALLSIFFYPNATLVLGGVALLVSLAFAIRSIIQKHKNKPNNYKNILRELGIFAVTLLLVILFGGLAGAFVNLYVSQFYGAILGLVCGLVIAFAVGYWIRKGISKVSG
jgi:ABC-type anion transport system duplicated permease subunit